MPGATQLNRISFEAEEAEAASAKPSIPALAAEIALWFASPIRRPQWRATQRSRPVAPS
jgi:hypothetical protein